MNNWSEQEMSEAMDAVWEKATTDKDFRDLCLRNAGEALKAVTGKDVPADYKVKFVESDPAYNETWALPVFKGAADELSDAELDMAAGGK